VFRLLSNTFLSLLLVGTLLWGGCVSCERFFMLPQLKTDCCKAGKCERTQGKIPVQRECNKQPMDSPGEHPVVPQMNATLSDLDSFVLVAARVELGPVGEIAAAPEHSPPDLLLLFSTFLI
jgi:hypothetical protein